MFWNHVTASGEEICCLGVKPLWADVFGMTYRGLESSAPLSVWTQFLESALIAAREQGAGKLMMRLEQKGIAPEIAAELVRLGFVRKLERIEYRLPLNELPDEAGTPLTWQHAGELRLTTQAIAQLVLRASEGDPDADPSEDPEKYIVDWLDDPELNCGMECIRVGHLNGVIAALVVAQINPQDGWSRLSYMGVLPEFRGRGLGKWVHRHGFTELRRQGGVFYHGGTCSPNLAMRRLFETSGAKLYRVMDEWVLNF
jgi:ribosomal protein S18 acetylase RimI-like enzyme